LFTTEDAESTEKKKNKTKVPFAFSVRSVFSVLKTNLCAEQVLPSQAAVSFRAKAHPHDRKRPLFTTEDTESAEKKKEKNKTNVSLNSQ